MADEIKKGKERLIKGLLSYLPLQDRTLIETLRGDTSPITAQSIGPEYLNQLNDIIEKTRDVRALSVEGKNQERFNKGAGYVNYDLYDQAGMPISDFNMAPSGGVRNTLGQFSYETLPNGNVRVKDRYDFLNDRFPGMSLSQSQTSRYANMNPMAKALLVGKETFQPGGWDSLPSRFGNAFIGDRGRDVNIEFKPRQPLKTKQQIRPDSDDIEKAFEAAVISPDEEKKFKYTK